MERMNPLTASPEYIELLNKFPSPVLRSEKQNEACTEFLYELGRRSRTLDPNSQLLNVDVQTNGHGFLRRPLELADFGFGLVEDFRHIGPLLTSNVFSAPSRSIRMISTL
jgi:hypothetical protein